MSFSIFQASLLQWRRHVNAQVVKITEMNLGFGLLDFKSVGVKATKKATDLNSIVTYVLYGAWNIITEILLAISYTSYCKK